ncbi:hypothetical protein BX070DRAFT_46607 [Coemansia spiralis]|nr:hypothetical protein BX070DRAFT_46607 [Coemansia spiralis]
MQRPASRPASQTCLPATWPAASASPIPAGCTADQRTFPPGASPKQTPRRTVSHSQRRTPQNPLHWGASVCPHRTRADGGLRWRVGTPRLAHRFHY